MGALVGAAGGSAWSYGGAILTFVFPMVLFIAVVGLLFVVYTKPHVIPGHYYRMGGRPAPGGAGQTQAGTVQPPAGTGSGPQPGEGRAGGDAPGPGAQQGPR